MRTLEEQKYFSEVSMPTLIKIKELKTTEYWEVSITGEQAHLFQKDEQAFFIKYPELGWKWTTEIESEEPLIEYEITD